MYDMTVAVYFKGDKTFTFVSADVRKGDMLVTLTTYNDKAAPTDVSFGIERVFRVKTEPKPEGRGNNPNV